MFLCEILNRIMGIPFCATFDQNTKNSYLFFIQNKCSCFIKRTIVSSLAILQKQNTGVQFLIYEIPFFWIRYFFIRTNVWQIYPSSLTRSAKFQEYDLNYCRPTWDAFCGKLQYSRSWLLLFIHFTQVYDVFEVCNISTVDLGFNHIFNWIFSDFVLEVRYGYHFIWQKIAQTGPGFRITPIQLYIPLFVIFNFNDRKLPVQIHIII